MKVTASSDTNQIAFYNEQTCLNYAPDKVQLPVKESYYVQIGTGDHTVDVKMARAGKIGMLKLIINVESVGVISFQPDYVGFVIPLSWSGEYYINGEAVNKSSIYMAGDLDSIHQRSKSREKYGLILPKEQFVETIAALRGVDIEDIKLHDRELRLREKDGYKLRAQLAPIFNIACDNQTPHSANELSHKVFDLLTDAYLHAIPGATAKTSRASDPNRIVRLAEEHFMAAGKNYISLADLCRATGVGKTALYSSFNRVCGIPPLAYFHKRRLMRAHAQLIDSADTRGQVKRTALSTGFTELGRFATEYRQLFGESPSETLSRNAT